MKLAKKLRRLVRGLNLGCPPTEGELYALTEAARLLAAYEVACGPRLKCCGAFAVEHTRMYEEIGDGYACPVDEQITLYTEWPKKYKRWIKRRWRRGVSE